MTRVLSRNRAVAVGAVAAMLMTVGAVAYSATSETVASCTPSPTVSTDATARTQSVTTTCTIPLPAVETTTATVTAPPVTSTTTVTQPPVTTTTTVTATATTTPVSAPLLTGFRANDVSWGEADALIGPGKVTRLFYSGQLPTTYSRQGIPAGVKLIVSYKAAGNTAAYVKSIPAGDDVEVVYHHEPEADYSTGATFVKEFDAEADVAHAANPRIPFAFIGGAYQYRKGAQVTGFGYDGSFLPSKADRHYLDSYQPNLADLQPAQTDPRVQRFIELLTARGEKWDGFTEYGRGVIPPGGTFDQAVADKRVQVIKADKAWLPSQGIRVWSYWYTTGAQGQWRFTDQASIDAWRS